VRGLIVRRDAKLHGTALPIFIISRPETSSSFSQKFNVLGGSDKSLALLRI